MIKLLIDYREFLEFSSIAVSKSIENIATGFTISFIGKIDFEVNSKITILKDSYILCDGYVEKIQRSDSIGVTTVIQGRSQSGQLIGGSIIGKTEYKNKKVDYIIKKITEKYNINLSFVGNMGKPIKKFSIETGEDPYSAIKRLLTLRSLIAFDEQGVLNIRESSDVTYSDTIDNNNFKINSTEDFSSLYSEYTVVGNGDQKNIKYTANNYLVNKYRPKKIIAETKVTKNTVKKMAEFELQKAIGKSKTATASGISWTQPNGNIWKINSLSPVDSQNANIVKNMLIASVNYTFSNNGEKIDMNLVGEDTYK